MVGIVREVINMDEENELVEPYWVKEENGVRRERYRVEAWEACDWPEAIGSEKECKSYAIDYIREKCTIYRIPCGWRCWRKYGTYIVERVSSVGAISKS
jgi:hypothetical protein